MGRRYPISIYWWVIPTSAGAHFAKRREPAGSLMPVVRMQRRTREHKPVVQELPGQIISLAAVRKKRGRV